MDDNHEFLEKNADMADVGMMMNKVSSIDFTKPIPTNKMVSKLNPFATGL